MDDKGDHADTDDRPAALRHPEPCSMAWPADVCNCIGCVYRQIAQELWVGFASAWAEWPEGGVVRRSELMKHFGHPVTMTMVRSTAAIVVRCEQCKTTMIVNRGHYSEVLEHSTISGQIKKPLRP